MTKLFGQKKGAMETSLLKTLLNTTSQFGLLSSCNIIKSELVHKYYQKIDEWLKLLRPVFDELTDFEITSDEQLNMALEDLDAVVNDSRKLLESWDQMTSKIYFVLQTESLMTKIQTSGLEICRLANSLLQSHTDSSTFACVQQMQWTTSDQISDVIKEAMGDLQDKSVPSSQSLAKIADSLNLKSNQELLLEAVALEKVKTKAVNDQNNGDSDSIDDMITLVTHMHDSLVKIEQCQSINGITIPADFCCPLSLKLMSDPVIVATGQTYERAFIRKWLEQGLIVCPKTRQTLSHVNLIPNYTVKALIANWCESNNIKLPDPVKLASLNSPSTHLAHTDSSSGDGTTRPRSPESAKSMVSQKSSVSSNGTNLNDKSASPSHYNSFPEGTVVSRLSLGSRSDTANGFEKDAVKTSSGSSGERNLGHDGQTSTPSRWEVPETSMAGEFQGHNRTTSISSAVSSNEDLQGTGDANEQSHVSRDLTHYGSDASGELTSDAPTSSAPHKEPEFSSSRLAETRPRSQSIWRRPSERFVPRIVSSGLETRADLSGVEAQVRNLIEDL